MLEVLALVSHSVLYCTKFKIRFFLNKKLNIKNYKLFKMEPPQQFSNNYMKHTDTEFFYENRIGRNGKILKTTTVELNKLVQKGFKTQSFTRFINNKTSEETDDTGAIKTISRPRVVVYYNEKLGLGLKAGQFIPGGTVIREYCGNEYKGSAAETLSKGGWGKYLRANGKGNIVDSMYCGNEARFIEHNCGEVNCQFVVDKNIVNVMSIRNIMEGEVLTIKYNERNDNPKDMHRGIIKCLCDYNGSDGHIYDKTVMPGENSLRGADGKFRTLFKPFMRDSSGRFIPRTARDIQVFINENL